ncbi:A/G-specific adenine glycosylase [Pseudorhodobacter sp. MZDSW-24AT]|nr:A/G-specific adenine glycosylase [Pseudorhodobacter sp. MZDSW-24AT]PJF09912.1 A/G-specific adenine glycosylase [Pseudorhodobacter sp. MZDSW-24AT]
MALLRWYDRHARVMPWRVSPQDRALGVRPDPYRIWLSEVMLQQTTVAAVKDYFHRFTARWPTVADLAAARDEDVMAEWAGLGYYARARNLLKAARAVAQDHAGKFPGNREALLALPGIGPYTASAIAAIAYDEPATVVDGNVERVMARLHAVETPLPPAKAALTALAAELTPAHRPGDYAQAVMDLGATICTPRNPACGLCPWNDVCEARRLGVQAELPRKVAKGEKPTRRGVLWLATQGNRIVLERRPEKGLLGGMLGFPGDGWDGYGGLPPALAEWQEIGDVRHTFTHFHLHLTLCAAELPADVVVSRGALYAPDAFRPADLPTVMRKAYDQLRSVLPR